MGSIGTTCTLQVELEPGTMKEYVKYLGSSTR